ncbi:MAG: hypothetical protein GX879_01850, partial [Bacteroidales bacterium]|nr:hypothetical protein [Bacteroidales bacterium]
YKSGKIEMFYGSANIPFNAKWISGVSSGNYVNYNLFAQTNSPELQANKKFTLMPFEAPEEFHLSHSGLLTAHPTQELLQNQLHFKITDANGVIGRKILPISTQGLFINTSFQPENGEYITWGSNTKLKLNLSNAAEVPITNLVATLSSNHSQVIITKAVLDLPYLGPGHQLSIPNAFEFQTLYDFYNGEEISFNLNIVSDQGTWEFELNEKVYIPDIQYHDQFVDDNDNNRYDIGETADLVISLINNGFADLNNLECKIFTDDEYVSINSNFFTIDEIKAGQTEIGIYNLSISNIAPDGHVALINMEITGNHNYTKNIEFKISIGQFVENWETNDFTSFQWENGGNETWFITTENPYEGTYCLKSGAITHNQVSDIYLTVEILASGNISFFHKVSCEANSNALWDNLSFSIDGVEKGRWAGETDWTEASIPITTGIHTLQWRYKKDVSVSQGEDCAWIDNITFPPLFDSPPILNITPTNIVKQMPQNQVDEEYIFIKNEGGGYLHYNIQAIDTSVVENRSIAGSNVFCSTEHYEPGTTTTLVLTVNNNSNDTEWIKQVEMTFPEGFEVISSGDINCPDGVLSSNNELGDAAHIVWLGEDANGWGVLRNGKSGITSVTGIIAEDFTGDFIINYTLVGDIYGAEPHT